MTNQPKKLLDQVRDVLRMKHYSIRTENRYVSWIKRYIFFHGKRHPKDMGAPEVEEFLAYLARQQKVSAVLNKGGKGVISPSDTLRPL